MVVPFFRAFVRAAKAVSVPYEEGIAGMLTIIKASLLGSALMLLENCTGYLTSRGTSANAYSTRRYTGVGSTVAITEEADQGLISLLAGRALRLNYRRAWYGGDRWLVERAKRTPVS
jgi:hypothetical protein